jgi:cell division protein ZipA
MELLSNFGMREWLIGCGIILVLVVLVDGFRRMRSERKSEIKMSLALGGGFPDNGEDEGYGSELPNGGARVVVREEPDMGDFEAFNAEPEPLQQSEDTLAELAKEQQREQNQEPVTELLGDQLLLVMHVKARQEKEFNGSDLLQILLACDMRYGDKQILHRHERAGGQGCLQFSVANMIEPGTFNLEDINSFRTPGVTFFMGLPGPDDPMQAFECMIETANCLVKNLDAMLLDENHSTASLQVINHYREQVAQYMQQAGNKETV